MDEVTNLLELILKAMVTKPEEVKVEKTSDEMGVLCNVSVNASDMGIIIGKGGSTANAIKLIIKIAGYKTKSHVAIKIKEPLSE